MDNIKYGAVDPSAASDEDVFAAAREADVHSVIMSLPLVYQTQVGEKGGMLSGGHCVIAPRPWSACFGD